MGAGFCFVSFFTNAQSPVNTAQARMASLQQKEALEKRSLLNSIPFRNIGPSVMSGRVVDITANPTDPTEFYVAYASGGVWYTHNNGQSFTPVFDHADVLTIGAIAVNWKTGTIWVGTGEVNSSRSSYAGTGVYKSDDKGKSWQYLGLPESHHIGKIQLHPTDNQVAWVAVLGHLYTPNKERGVYKTTDGGKTWKQTLYVDDNTGVVDLDINTQNPNEVYAAAWYRTRSAWNFEEGGKSSGIYKSTDGGSTWNLVTRQGAGFPVGEGVGRIGLAVYPKNPQIVYAVLDNNFHRPDTAKKDTLAYALKDFEKLTREQFQQLDPKRLDTFLKRNRLFPRYNARMIMERVANGSLSSTVLWDYLYNPNASPTPVVGAEIYRSDNGGQTWKRTHSKDLPTGFFNGYGYYFSKIFVSPVNDQKIIVTGFNVQLSNDGGKTFTKVDKENTHVDHHICWIDPSHDDHFIIGNDGGANITYDNGEHWFKANTPAVGQFYSVAVDNAKPYNVYGGLQDNEVWYGPSTTKDNTAWQNNGENPFKLIFPGGDGMMVQVDTRDNATAYGGFQFGSYYRTNRLNRENRKYIQPQNELGQPLLRFNWLTPIVISKHNQDVIYMAGNKFFRSLNKADTVIAMSGDLTNGPRTGDVPFGTITTITESPLRFGYLYAGTDDGNIQFSKDGGYTWTLLNPQSATKKNQNTALPKGLWVSRLQASQFNEGRVYAAFNGYRNDDFAPYLFVSNDYGTTWQPIGKDLPAEPINVVREDPKNENIIYVGTDGGLYVSFDRGASFMSWNGNLPKAVPVYDIAIQERENEIVLGTHGRSIYIAKLEDVQGLQKDKDWLKKKPAKDATKQKETDSEQESEMEMRETD